MAVRSISKIDVMDLLRALEIRNVTISRKWATFSCPFGEGHKHGDSNPSAYMNLETSSWRCWGCGESGSNAISFLSKIKMITYHAAKQILEARYGSKELTAPIDDLESEVLRIYAQKQKVVDPPRKAPSEEWIKNFHVDWHESVLSISPWVSYMVDQRGFDPNWLDRWGVGVDIYSRRIAIPVRDVDGNLVGFKGRAWDKDLHPKYLIIGDSFHRAPKYGFDCYHKSRHVFGLDWVSKPSIETQTNLIICEGELNVISMTQKGFSNVVGVAGSEFSPTQAALVISRASSATVFFDSDKAGNAGSRKVVDMLRPYMRVFVVPYHEGDAAELEAGQIRKLLDDAQPALLADVLEKLG